MIGVFDADPDSDTYGHSLDCFPLICDEEDGCCIDPKEGKFPASELAAGTWTDSSGTEHVILFASFHPDYQGRDCYEEPDNTDCPWIKEMAGTLAVIDPEGGRLLGVENFNDLSSKVYDFGLCDTDQWFDLRSIAWNPCACDETCQDGLLYVTAMKYGPTDHCHDGAKTVDGQDKCHRHDVAMESYVLAFSYQMEDCNEYKWIRLEGVKTLPVREGECSCGQPRYGCCNHECYEDHPWSPADIVATQWVPQIAVEVDVPLDASDMFVGGTVTVTYDYEGDDKNFTDNTLDMTLQYDPTLLSVDKTSVMVKLGDVEAALGAGFVTGDEGQVTLQNVLAPVSGILSDGDKLVVEVDMDVLATSTEETSILAYFDDPIGGYNCCMTYGNSEPVDPTEPACCDSNDPNVALVTGEDGEAEGNEYTGEAVYFQMTCSGDVTADPVEVRFFFEDCTGISALTNLYVWDDVAAEWVAFTGTVAYITDTDDDWPEGANEDWGCALVVDVATDSDFCDQFFALSAETDVTEMNPADDNGGGGSDISKSSSSGCNVGFSAAALLFAIPLVSIFRKR
jgi:Synergist-CTERM protein sorting domain-containing protein